MSFEVGLRPRDVDVHSIKVWEFVIDAAFDPSMWGNHILLKHQRCFHNGCDASGLVSMISKNIDRGRNSLTASE